MTEGSDKKGYMEGERVRERLMREKMSGTGGETSGFEEIWIVSEKEENEREVGRIVRKKKFMEKMNLLMNLFLFFVLFWAAMYLIDNKAKIYELNSKNLALEKEVADLQSRISEKNVLISSQFSLETIHHIASEELGMVYPSASRVTSLNAERYFSLEYVDERLPKFVLNTKILKAK